MSAYRNSADIFLVCDSGIAIEVESTTIAGEDWRHSKII